MGSGLGSGDPTNQQRLGGAHDGLEGDLAGGPRGLIDASQTFGLAGAGARVPPPNAEEMWNDRWGEGGMSQVSLDTSGEGKSL